MEFGLSEDQRLIEQSLKGYLGDQLPMEEIRRITDTRTGFDDALWQGLTDLGIPGLLIAEKHGGSALSFLDAAIVAEALGYAAAPTPYVAKAVMAPMALSLAGSTAQQGEYLPRMAAGTMRVALAAGALSGTTGETGLSLSNDRLTGQASGLIDGGGATHMLVYLADGRAVLADATGPGIAIQSRPTIDRTRPLADVTFSDAAVTLLGGEGNTLESARTVLDAGRLILAADTLGAGQCMVEKAVAYAGERVQFDRVIASFQAVKHMCAEMAAALEPCRSLIWYAAHAQDHIVDERRMLASLAKAHLNDVGRDVSRTATEVHGGMGFTDLMGLHFWFKRCGFNRQVLGSSERCRNDAAQAQGWLAA